jgi:hypothetical protein
VFIVGLLMRSLDGVIPALVKRSNDNRFDEF